VPFSQERTRGKRVCAALRADWRRSNCCGTASLSLRDGHREVLATDWRSDGSHGPTAAVCDLVQPDTANINVPSHSERPTYHAHTWFRL